MCVCMEENASCEISLFFLRKGISKGELWSKVKGEIEHGYGGYGGGQAYFKSLGKEERANS